MTNIFLLAGLYEYHRRTVGIYIFSYFQIFTTGNYVQLPAIWANNGGIVNILIKFCQSAGKWLHTQCSASNNCFWGLAANIASKSRKKIMNATIFQHIGSLLSGHPPYSWRDSLDTTNSRVPGKKNHRGSQYHKFWRCRQARCWRCAVCRIHSQL